MDPSDYTRSDAPAKDPRRTRRRARTFIGRDALGAIQLAALRRERVILSQTARHTKLGSGVTGAFSTADDRGFITYPGCTADAARLLRIRDLAALKRAHHVHFAGMPAPFGQRLVVLEALAAAHVTTSLDIGWNPGRYGEPVFREVLRRVTVFLPSWRDAQWLTERVTPEDAVRALGEIVPVPVIKLGAGGACAVCPHMKRNTMEKLYLCMKYEMPEIVLPQWVIEQGRKSIDRMMEISEKAGLGLKG